MWLVGNIGRVASRVCIAVFLGGILRVRYCGRCCVLSGREGSFAGMVFWVSTGCGSRGGYNSFVAGVVMRPMLKLPRYDTGVKMQKLVEYPGTIYQYTR